MMDMDVDHVRILNQAIFSLAYLPDKTADQSLLSAFQIPGGRADDIFLGVNDWRIGQVF